MSDITQKIIDQFESRKQVIDIETIQEYKFNNKEHWEEQIDLLAKSIEKFGFTTPLVVDENFVLVVGHGRYLAAKKLGITKIPVLVASDLTEDELREYRVLDNRVTDMSIWNYKNLEAELKEIWSQELNNMFTSFSFMDVWFGGEPNYDNTFEENLWADEEVTRASQPQANDEDLKDNIKKIEFHYRNEEYILVLEKMEAEMQSMGIWDISTMFLNKIRDLYTKKTNG